MRNPALTMEQIRRARKTKTCPYATSCFECPMPDCSITSQLSQIVNQTPLEQEERANRTYQGKMKDR
nr:MAG TPA: hypothetical protein [Caudoviricetes sp.]